MKKEKDHHYLYCRMHSRFRHFFFPFFKPVLLYSSGTVTVEESKETAFDKTQTFITLPSTVDTIIFAAGAILHSAEFSFPLPV
jgi:hypothetical protein